jgi:hypothetical protein
MIIIVIIVIIHITPIISFFMTFFSCFCCIDIEPFEDYTSKIINTEVSNPLLQSSSSSSVAIDGPPSTVTLYPTRSLISSSTDSPLLSLLPHQSSSRSSAASLSSAALSSSKSTTTTTSSGLFDYLHHVVAVGDLKASDVPLVAAMDESLNKLTVSSPSLSSTYSQHSQSFVAASSSSSLPYTRPINCSINQVFSILINMYLIDQSLLYHL